MVVLLTLSRPLPHPSAWAPVELWTCPATTASTVVSLRGNIEEILRGAK